MVTFMSLAFLPLQSNAAAIAASSSSSVPKSAESSEVKALELRLNEINAMDKSNLKSAEKRNLRKEVKSINHRLKEIGGGVYVSAGALILLIILLLVLL